jgi:hypothetical protein
MGKSTLTHHLLKIMSSKFDLVISFMGSSACSPEMRTLLETHFDPRFVFSSWNQRLMDKLLKQQEKLKNQGTPRQICVLVDDIIMTSKDEDSLAHLCLRGRHFNISVIACAVSYTTLPKRSRRSLDVLFLFSCPMSGDCKLLCSEYANQSRMARYCLQNLPEYTCLVMETLQRQQKLFHYRVDLENTTLFSPIETYTAPSLVKSSHSQTVDDPDENCGSSHDISETPETCVSDALDEYPQTRPQTQTQSDAAGL